MSARERMKRRECTCLISAVHDAEILHACARHHISCDAVSIRGAQKVRRYASAKIRLVPEETDYVKYAQNICADSFQNIFKESRYGARKSIRPLLVMD